MSASCCIPSCDSDKYKGRKFTRIPINDIRVYNIWLQRINNPKLFTLPPKKVYNGYRVCSRHFDKKSFSPSYKSLDGRLLVKGAVPTLFLTREDENIDEEEQSIKMEQTAFIVEHRDPLSNTGVSMSTSSSESSDETTIQLRTSHVSYGIVGLRLHRFTSDISTRN